MVTQRVKRTVGEIKQEYEPTTGEEKLDRRNEMKDRGNLYERGMEETKNLIKFKELQSSNNMRTLKDQVQKQWIKLLTHALIWRNKEEIKTISLDDLYNNLKIYRHELAGSSSTSQNPQNVAFMSSKSTNSDCNNNINEVYNTAYGVSAAHTQCNSTSRDNLSGAMICAFLASQPNSPQLAREDLEQIDPNDLEKMDLQWEMTKVECYNCHKNGHFARECRAPRNQKNRGRENSRRTMTVETPTKNALAAQDGIDSNGKKVESNHESADVKNNSDAVEPKTIRKNSFSYFDESQVLAEKFMKG
ncbi:ribonuclease H-like domain-containing protein [Tanacetum coccineum]